MGQDDKLTEEQILQAELDALRVANEPLHARARVTALRKQIAEERKAAQVSSLIEKYTADLGGLPDIEFRVVAIDDHFVVVRKPHELVYKKFRDRGKTDTVSCLELVKPCLVHPSKEEFNAICEQKPAMADAAAGAVLYLGGVRAESQEGK
jgi:23S rRNA-/tRNA-specific pseudouridylate synthase